GGTNGLWALEKGEWRQQTDGPNGGTAFGAEPAGNAWALAASGVWRLADHWQLIHTVDDDDMAGPHKILPTGPREVLVASDTGLYGLMGKRLYWLRLEARPDAVLSDNVRDVARLDVDHFLVATDKGLNISTGTTGWRAITGAQGLPILDLT